jgi:rhamnogalacturonan endolyase
MFGRFRHYGLWGRYAELYPDTDLVYTVGVSDYSKDWFFAQVPRCDSLSIDFIWPHRFG